MGESAHRARVTFAGLVAAIAMCGGCVDNFAPDIGPQVLDKCRNRDSDPDVEVSFKDDILKGIIKGVGMCVPCHDPDGKTPQGYQVGGLNLTSHGSLMAGGVNSAADIVIPGEPCNSRLLQKVGASPPSGSRMPLVGNPLSAKHQQLIADWIAEGALNN